MAEFEAGNLYDMNKNLVAQVEKPLKGKALTNKINNEIIPYLNEKLANHSYFMLLCHEKRDYTVFHISDRDKMETAIAQELKECLANRGTIYGIDKTEDTVALEIWINYQNEEMVCYYFFPYDSGVIEL